MDASALASTLAYWNLVIRPPRASYKTSQLGPPKFIIDGVRAQRTDVRLRLPSGVVIECSHFVPRALPGESERRPVVVYVHGNSGNRLDIEGFLGPFMKRGVSLFCYDSIGCGLSEGDYLSLGWHERDVLSAVIKYLRGSPLCGKVGVWGRSMGAATALLHAHRDATLAALVLDSPFSSLPALIEELMQKGDPSGTVPLSVPSWLCAPAMALLRNRVQALAGFDIEDVVPLNHVSKSKVPALFMHARADNFVPSSHSKALFDRYGGGKSFLLIEGSHNSKRSKNDVERCVEFLCKAVIEVDASASLARSAARGGA